MDKIENKKAGIIDRYGRCIDYLRVSVTDRCNLRCMYCLPEEGVELTTSDKLLSFGEIVRICMVMASMGLRKIKLTGGEPLIRRNLPALVGELKSIPGIESVTLTTNGIRLPNMMQDLVDAGIDAVNISLDTLDRELFYRITRRDELLKVLDGIHKALEYPEVALKINCVPLGLPEQNIVEMASLAKDYPLHVRFIEMMPIGFGKNFDFLSEDDILKQIESVYGRVLPFKQSLGNGPCHYYSVDSFKGKIGFISAISHKFCNQCNRVRLTSQGFLKTCLQYDKGKDLRDFMRSGCTDEELSYQIQSAVFEKPDAHRFLSGEIAGENQLAMSQIGG
jgi:cyclic pyranopterin phosphate synthase